MKKIFALLLLFTLAFSVASVAMAGCSKHPYADDSYHPYTYYEDWSSDHHKTFWDDVVYCGECGDVVSVDGGESLDAHSYYNGYCEWCGHAQSDVPSYQELQAAAQKRVTDDPEGIAGKTAIVVHNGNLRAAASQDSADLGAVITDDEYQILSYQISADNTIWLEIKHLDGTAWVSASLVKISGDNTQDDGYAAYYVNRTCKITVSSGRARFAPGKKAPQVAYVRNGEKYKILGVQSASDGTLWFQIKVDGAECWISSGIASVEGN